MVGEAKYMKSNKYIKYIDLIETSNVYDVAQVTPVTKANTLSKHLKNEIFLKREDLQPVFSFKITEALPVSEPVPAVVGTAMIGAILSGLAFFQLSPTSSKFHIGNV